MRLDPEQCRRHVVGARFAVLATQGRDGAADLVPITFALIRLGSTDLLVSAVDHKPKSTSQLARLANIQSRPLVTVLFDHRDDDDWSALWWVRARGPATVRPPGFALEALVDRYPQYRSNPPHGQVVAVEIATWQGWSARDGLTTPGHPRGTA